MPRKLRLEFPGAIYHVINRGNYRRWIFRDAATRTAFQSCLFDACQRCEWLLHAFVVMGNHFHLALETPKGNPVAGMHWLLATFACRFNRFRSEQGHLFQGRYKSLLVEEGAALGQLCHYIHLNPVRAGLVTVPDLSDYRHGSYAFMSQPAGRPPFLRVETALIEAGELPDSPAGRRCYRDYLEWQAEEGPAGKSRAYANLSRGWALGSHEFKAALVREHNLAPYVRALEISGAREVNALRWSESLARALRALRRTTAESIHAPKSAEWKLAVAAWMKSHTDASNGWLAEALNLGAPAALSRNLTRFRRSCLQDQSAWRELTSIAAT